MKIMYAWLFIRRMTACFLFVFFPSGIVLAQTASDALVASAKAQMLPYDISSAGVEQPVRWGIDTAWRWSWWPLRATNHMRECVSLGRVTIDPRVDAVYTSLSSDQKAGLDEQLSWLEKSGVTVLYLLAGNASGTAWQTSYRAGYISDIALAVEYLQGKGYTVTAISHFNEPDYASNNAPSASEMATVASLMHENSTLASIDIAGPSTLNPDYANSWWSTMSGSLQIGNTHQLAGTFDNFAGFYAAVQSSGKKSAGDELHNINDALIGMNYGMADGIWWSDFGSYTRAELGRASNDGSRIGYAENRSAWTSAAVFRRNSENLVEAFLGTSERQAGASAYCFVSQDRLAYYDGYGPYYDYTKETPGGTGYQTGQTNAECVVEITQGEDVPVAPLDGTFKIVNKATGKLLTVSGLSNNSSITQNMESNTANQSWVVKAVDPLLVADFAHVTIAAAKNTTYYLDAKKYAADNGAALLLYAGGGNECERWHLHYMGEGYYTITNYDSGLSLEGSGDNTDTNTTSVVQWERTGTDRQLWKFVPSSATVDTEAPAKPMGLQAESLSGSVRLCWEPNTETDLLGYMVYRYNDDAGLWETIGRQISQPQFLDNYCAKGHSYKYRVRAVDQSWNISEPSAVTNGVTATEGSLIGEWHLRTTLDDYSENAMNAVSTGVTFQDDEEHAGAVFDGNDDYVSLPYHAADMQEMSFGAWIKVSTTTAWQRIFDFSRSTENYMMLTPSNGSRLRFEICKDGTKQGLNATKRLTANTWTHVVVTLGANGAFIYLNGELNASSSDVTFRPSDIRPILSYIGRSMFDSDPLFKGSIGDIRLYNYVLDATEVKSLYYQDKIAAASELLSHPMNGEVRQSLVSAVDALQTAIDSGESGTVQTTYSALISSISEAKASVEAYRPLGEMLAWSKKLSIEHPQTDSDASVTYGQAYTQTESSYLAGDYDDSEISGITTAVRTFTNRYLMTDVSKTTQTTDISFLLMNADFADNSLENWTLTTNETNYRGALNYDCFEVWNHTFRIEQRLPGMPQGKYKLQTQAFYRNGSKENSADTEVNATIFIADNVSEISPISRSASSTTSSGDWYAYASSKYVPNDMEAAAAAFNSLGRYKPSRSLNVLTADYVPDADDILVVGMQKTVAVADDWTIVNYFQLYYTGAGDTGVENIETSNGKWQKDDITYDLSGRQVTNPVQGVYIKGGKKVIVRSASH